MDYAFNDLGGLQSINKLAKKDRGAAISQVAQQFESFFVSQMIKGMRAANELLAADDPFQTQEMQFRQQMLDDQLGISLSQGRGLGLAEVFERGLRRQFGVEEKPEAAVRPDGTTDLDARRIDRAPAVGQTEPAAAPSPSDVAEPAVPREVTAPALAASPATAPGMSDMLRGAIDAIEPAVERAREAASAAIERFSDKKGFVETLAPMARKAAEKLGVDHRVLLAQAALETGWGQSILGDSAGRSSFNLFNIKAGSFWTGGSVGVNTLEVRDGIPRSERARFRAYGSFEESFSDYADTLLGSGRYRDAIRSAGDAASFVHGLARGGYATDPAYAKKILTLLRDPAIAGAP